MLHNNLLLGNIVSRCASWTFNHKHDCTIPIFLSLRKSSIHQESHNQTYTNNTHIQRYTFPVVLYCLYFVNVDYRREKSYWCVTSKKLDIFVTFKENQGKWLSIGYTTTVFLALITPKIIPSQNFIFSFSWTRVVFERETRQLSSHSI